MARKLSFRTIYQCWLKTKRHYWVIKMSHSCRHFKKNLQIPLKPKWQNRFRHENIHFGSVGDPHRFWKRKINENFENFQKFSVLLEKMISTFYLKCYDLKMWQTIFMDICDHAHLLKDRIVNIHDRTRLEIFPYEITFRS